jgi:hypothetical protein
MASSLTKGLAIGATLFGGVLAGLTADRSLIQMAAWHHIGVIPWANFTRAAYAVPGFILNPAVGLAGLLLTVGTAIALRFDRTARGFRWFPIYAAAVLAVAGAVVTRGILVPVMMRVRESAISGAELQQLFLTGVRWWAINDVLHALTFGFNLWALVAVWSAAESGSRDATR